jgi:hypothetical protein
MPDREALVRTLAAPTGRQREAMEAALDRAADALLVRYAAGERAAVREESRALFADAVSRYADPPAGVSDEEAARLIHGLADIPVRDEVASWGAGARAEPLAALLTDLACRALPPVDAPTVTVLAWVAYLRGNGTLAAIALERATASDPSYSLALLLRDALRRQLPPQALRQASRIATGPLDQRRGRPPPARRRGGSG